MRRWLRSFAIICLFLTIFFNSRSITEAENASDKNYRVLCLLSYNYAYDIVPDETDGIEAGLLSEEYDLNISLTYESMDTKNFFTSSDIQEFYDYLAYKMGKTEKYDLLIVADDTALRFALNYRDTLFKDMPIVFMGINSISEAESAAVLENVTGVAEIPDFESNYELMKKLFPERDTIVAIVDGTNTGQGEYVQFMNFISQYPDQKYKILNTSRYSKNGVREYLGNLDENDIILYLDFVEDGDGNIYSLEAATKLISQSVNNVPIFRTSSADIENGVLGGVSYSFYDAGKEAGDMAARILMGTPPKDISMVSDTVTITYFEQSALDKYGIKIKNLPEGTYVINEHETFGKWYRKNVLITNLVGLVCILLITIIVILSITIRRREKTINTDPLTGIANRLYIGKLVRPLAAHKERHALIIVDVDYFKQINDTKGHQVGDEVLIDIARLLQKVSKEYGATAARIGGDEFVILVKEPYADKCEEIAGKVREALKNGIRVKKDIITPTLSMGGAIYPIDTENPSRLMTMADQALYRVKKDGRNGFRMYSPDLFNN